MDTSYWIACFLPLIIALWIFYGGRQNEKRRRILALVKRNRKKGLKTMSEVFERFIGKECVITTMNTTIVASVEAVDGNWLLIRAKDGTGQDNDMVNIDYISRIREFPRNRKGKKKLVAG